MDEPSKKDLKVYSSTILVKLPSGSIDLLQTEAGPVLQFNSSCNDALPYCKGMCCGNRNLYNTNLTIEESKKFQSFTLGHRPNEKFIQYDPLTRNCVYQDLTTGKCWVHDDKPKECQIWHCSPGGVGDNLVRRDRGWFMLPIDRVL